MTTQLVYITRTIPENGINLLKEQGYEVDISPHDRPLTQEELVLELSKKPYTALLSLLTDIVDAKVFDACPTLTIVANYTVGFNNIDIEEAKKRNIIVTNTQGTSSDAVAEHAVALMLAVAARVVEGDSFVRKGKYQGWDPCLLIGLDISKKKIGLIGAGAIGSKLAHILKHGFDCEILYHDVQRNSTLEEICNATYTDLDTLLRESDFISLHVPLLPSTTHLINKEKLELMKASAILVNTSRGPVIDEEALAEVLNDKRIAGAGLDVFEFEPKINEKLLTLDNVVLTPHIASSRKATRDQMSLIAAKNIVAVLSGNDPLTPVYKIS